MPIADPDRLNSGQLFGGHRILAPIACGGMAEIWLAEPAAASSDGEVVALKTLRPEQRAQPVVASLFDTERRILSALSHPHIVGYRGAGVDRGRPYLAMEYIHGKNLRQLRARFSDLEELCPRWLVIDILAAVCAGLHYAHALTGSSNQLIHRDVTPENVMIGFDGSIKLVDFGVSAPIMNKRSRSRVDQVVGKYQYMAPEQHLGYLGDPRSDIYSLGVVLYSLLAGRMPFVGPDGPEIRERIVSGTFPSLRDLELRGGFPLCDIAARAMARKPAHRYQSADELRQALLACTVARPRIGSTQAIQDFMRGLFPEELAPAAAEAPAPDMAAGSIDEEYPEISMVPSREPATVELGSRRRWPEATPQTHLNRPAALDVTFGALRPADRRQPNAAQAKPWPSPLPPALDESDAHCTK